MLQSILAFCVAALAITTFLLSPSRAHVGSLVLATGEWRPYASKTMDGYGKFARMVTVVLEEMGIEPEYRFYPWPRCFDAVVKGRVWAAFPYAYNEERAEKVWFSDPLSQSRSLFFYYDPLDGAKRFEVNDLSDLKQYRIGGVTGYYYEPIFRNAGVDVDYTTSEVQGLEKLVMHRIDLIPINEHVGWDLIHRHFPDKSDGFKTLEYVFSINELSLIVSRNYPNSREILDSFNAALQRCMEEGKLNFLDF